jgi:type IV secretory pathway VirJ component
MKLQRGLALLWAAAAVVHAQPRSPAPPPKVRAPAPAPLPAAMQTVTHGLFSDVLVFRPNGAAQQFVFLLSMNASPNAVEQQTIRGLVSAGAMVAAVPLVPFYRRLEQQDGKCTYGPGAFENLARHVQAFEQQPAYLMPMIVGSGATAPYAYALLAQAPAGIFASAISAGFCPRLALKTPPCAVNALRWSAAATGVDLLPATTALNGAWAALPPSGEGACTPAAAQAFVQRVPQARWLAASTPADAASSIEAAYAKLAVKQAAPPPPPSQLGNLPIVEVPVPDQAGAEPGRRFAVLLSGDGGWAGIDKGIAAALVAKGIPVAGFDSLRYFWSARTPEGLAADLDRIIRYYAARWKRSEVLLIGFSQGADVLPFAINRLAPDTRASVRYTALLALGQKASFEFHFANWIGPGGDKPIAPEASKLSAAATLCIYGSDERDSLCPTLAPAHVRALPLAGGHHFSGNYDVLAARILDAAPR